MWEASEALLLQGSKGEGDNVSPHSYIGLTVCRGGGQTKYFPNCQSKFVSGQDARAPLSGVC